MRYLFSAILQKGGDRVRHCPNLVGANIVHDYVVAVDALVDGMELWINPLLPVAAVHQKCHYDRLRC